MRPFISLVLLLALLASPVSTYAFTITKPERAGPWRLVCMQPNALQEHVARLTRMQLLNLYAADRSGEIKSPCDGAQLPVGTATIHSRWVRTRDNWWVLAQTIQFPNQSLWVTVDPSRAQYRQKPPEFRLRFLLTPNGVWEVIQ